MSYPVYNNYSINNNNVEKDRKTHMHTYWRGKEGQEEEEREGEKIAVKAIVKLTMFQFPFLTQITNVLIHFLYLSFYCFYFLVIVVPIWF